MEKPLAGWLWCSGNTEACGAFITGSIPVSHPNVDFVKKNFKHALTIACFFVSLILHQ